MRCPVHEIEFAASEGCPVCNVNFRLREAEKAQVEQMLPPDHNDLSGRGESDPNGIDQHAPGAKLDEGKQLAGEIILGFPRAMEALVEVATFGAKKYSRHGFLSVDNAETRYLDAAMRHLLKYGQGEALDPDSDLPHLSHALWNIAAMVEIGARQDSPSPGKATINIAVHPMDVEALEGLFEKHGDEIASLVNRYCKGLR